MGFDHEPLYTLDELATKTPQQLLRCLLPLERAVCYLPNIVITHDDANSLRQGKVISNLKDEHISGCVRLYENDEQFIGLGEMHFSEGLKVKRLLTENAYEKTS